MIEKRAKTNVSPGNKSPLPHFSDDDDECTYGLLASTVVAGGFSQTVYLALTSGYLFGC